MHESITLECRWRHSDDCKWDGPRETQKDKNCDQVITNNDSGFCECSNLNQTMKKGCDRGDFQTCFAACGGIDIDVTNY